MNANRIKVVLGKNRLKWWQNVKFVGWEDGVIRFAEFKL